MKLLNTWMSTATCTLALVTAVHAQLTPGPADQGRSGYRAGETEAGQAGLTGSVTKINKASKLIGMEVHNAQNERLGRIEDLAIDLPSGKIGYAVLSVGGFLGLGEKYIAVPVNELRPAPNGDGLLLNVDKARIQSMPGFARNDWPALNEVGPLASWRSDLGAQGAPGTVRSETGTSQEWTGVGRGRSQSQLQPDQSRQTFHGRITSLDSAAGKLTVTDAGRDQEFKIDKQATIRTANQPNGRLSDLKEGDTVSVGFHRQNGENIADHIQVTGQAEPEVK